MVATPKLNVRVAGTHDAVANLHVVGELATVTDVRDVQRRAGRSPLAARRREHARHHVVGASQTAEARRAVATPQRVQVEGIGQRDVLVSRIAGTLIRVVDGRHVRTMSRVLVEADVLALTQHAGNHVLVVVAGEANAVHVGIRRDDGGVRQIRAGTRVAGERRVRRVHQRDAKVARQERGVSRVRALGLRKALTGEVDRTGTVRATDGVDGGQTFVRGQEVRQREDVVLGHVRRRTEVRRVQVARQERDLTVERRQHEVRGRNHRVVAEKQGGALRGGVTTTDTGTDGASGLGRAGRVHVPQRSR